MPMPPWVSLIPGPWPATDPDAVILDLAPAAWWRFHDGSYSDAGTTLCVADDPIYRVVDKSGNARHVDQTTLAARPLWKPGILNGKAVGRFDGINDFMNGVATTSAARTVFLVARKNSAIGASYKTVLAQGSSNSQLHTNSAVGGGWSHFSPDVAIGGSATTFQIVELVYAGLAQMTPLVSGQVFSDINPHDGYTTTTGVYLGSSFGGTVNFGDYDTGEVIIYPVTLDSTGRTAVRSRLASYWGIAI